MLCLVPPSSLAELQSLRAEDGDQTSKKTHGKCDASCQVKIFSFFISAFVLSILSVFSISIVPRVVGIKNKTPAWDTCVAILTRFLLHPPWLPLPSKDVTGLICFPLLLGKIIPFPKHFPLIFFPKMPCRMIRTSHLVLCFLRLVGLATGIHLHRQV